MKLVNLPNPNPPIKRILVSVAAVQNLVLKIPIIQIVVTPRYNPIVALKMFSRFVVSTLNPKSFVKIVFGLKPYTNATGMIIRIEKIKCRFLIFNLS